jgi:TetR/AcrR family transcriptional regulator, transcriptional repressor for nem operon
MPRPRTQPKTAVVTQAMHLFWRRGYEPTSVDDLVRETGVSRHSLYGDYGGKEGLFMAALEAYSRDVVTPAFGRVEHETAQLEAVSLYFNEQISHGAARGFPGAGCLMANTMTEAAPHNAAIGARVDAHNARLCAGFRHALVNTRGGSLDESAANSMAEPMAVALMVFANGLWSFSRTVTDAAPLHAAVRHMLQLVEMRIAR